MLIASGSICWLYKKEQLALLNGIDTRYHVRYIFVQLTRERYIYIKREITDKKVGEKQKERVHTQSRQHAMILCVQLLRECVQYFFDELDKNMRCLIRLCILAILLLHSIEANNDEAPLTKLGGKTGPTLRFFYW